MSTIESELKKYLDERKPKSFNSMIESMSWYTRTRKEFMKKVKTGEIKLAHGTENPNL